jgi:hypothetical protein
MPFDLPVGTADPCEWASWAAFLNTYGGKDKILRVVQYSSRACQHWLLEKDQTSPWGLALKRTYQALSLHRKGFRVARVVSDVRDCAVTVKKAAAEEDSTARLIHWLWMARWAVMSYHIVFDNLFWITHPTVGLIIRPPGHWLNHGSVALTAKDTRGFSDIFAFTAALLEVWVSFFKRCDTAVTKEKCYDALKLALDVAVYWPQNSHTQWSGWHDKAGFNDRYIGGCGVAAAVVGARQVWKKISV